MRRGILRCRRGGGSKKKSLGALLMDPEDGWPTQGPGWGVANRQDTESSRGPMSMRQPGKLAEGDRRVSDRQAYGSCWLITAGRSINWVHSIRHPLGERRVEQSQSLFLSFHLAASTSILYGAQFQQSDDNRHRTLSQINLMAAAHFSQRVRGRGTETLP
jgi:hypothetical protein